MEYQVISLFISNLQMASVIIPISLLLKHMMNIIWTVEINCTISSVSEVNFVLKYKFKLN